MKLGVFLANWRFYWHKALRLRAYRKQNKAIVKAKKH